MRISFETRGVEQMAAKLRSRANAWSTRYKLIVYVTHASRNAAIAAAQAEAGRNPFFRTPREQREMQVKVRKLVEMARSQAAVGNGFDRIARDLARNVQAHIYQRLTSENPIGSGSRTAPLSPAYVEHKKKLVAKGIFRSVTPELIATGEFVDSIQGRAVRQRG